ncbi:MAG TPA: flagellar motor switch protein FliN [Thiobacillus sp.]|nr:MAG: flagellar motor switch protein FliN [Hydrogenophilales bacterium 28-61-11]OYZ57750.1 MAG: flagellar motor switch protein FliN [Hydrogenophilales bacterium 16-61-112]HQT31264.1 flagellar motor switch protein FliN [Thiobacillus sp.]HQT69838.1 flagellar motor switch protein FliN [Thiobacillus sp.]
MSEELTQPIAEDDWAAAMAEQAEPDKPVDDWAAAMAEQAEPAKVSPAVFKDLAGSTPTGATHDIDFILDIPVLLTVELGRTKITIKNLLQLAQGSVVELDGMAGEPMDVLVNGCLIAQGEVVVVNDKFGVRLTDIITPAERIRKLNK